MWRTNYEQTLYNHFPAPDIAIKLKLTDVKHLSWRHSREVQGSVLYYSYEEMFEVSKGIFWKKAGSKILFAKMLKAVSKKSMAQKKSRKIESLRKRLQTGKEWWQPFYNLASKKEGHGLSKMFGYRKLTALSCKTTLGWWDTQIFNNFMREMPL